MADVGGRPRLVTIATTAGTSGWGGDSEGQSLDPSSSASGRPAGGVRGGSAEPTQALRLAALQAELQTLRSRQALADLLTALSIEPGQSATDDDVLAAAAAGLVPTLADWCIVYLVRIDGSLEPLGIRHVDPHRQPALRELGRDLLLDLAAPVPVLRAAGTGQPQLRPVIGDAALTASCRGPRELSALREVGMASAMAIPISIGRRVVAVMLLARTAAIRHYDSEDLAVAQRVGGRIAGMLDHARLRREVASSDAHAVARFKVGQAIDKEADAPVMFQAVSQRIAEALGDGCIVRLLDPAGEVLRIAAVAHADPARREKLRQTPPAPTVPADAWLYQQALRNHAPIVLPHVDPRQYDRILPRPSVAFARLAGFRSLALAPLRRQSRPLGLLVLWRDRSPQPYTREDLVQLQELAGWISLAVDSGTSPAPA